jgi:hypothetical protein
MANWLFKEEPSNYSYDTLARDGKTSWTGVRNPVAQRHLRSIKKGDRIFFYHTGDEKAVVGIARALGDAYPDPADTSGKLHAVDFSLDPSRRYTVWTGVFGGLFLSLSYFGTDQSQVQRYIGGASLREGRLGLMFNAVLKIPMQFVILLLGALLFVFYQFAPHPVFFNQAEWRRHAEDSRHSTI